MIDASPWVEHNAIAARFDTGVRFWGKVVDQAGDPLEWVKIVSSVTTLRMIKTEHGYREFEVLQATSASDGTFNIVLPDVLPATTKLSAEGASPSQSGP